MSISPSTSPRALGAQSESTNIDPSRTNPQTPSIPPQSPSASTAQRVQATGAAAIPLAPAKTYSGQKFVAVVILLGGTTGIVAGAVLSQPVLIVAGAICALVGIILLIKANKAAAKAAAAHAIAAQTQATATQSATEAARLETEAKLAAEAAERARIAAETARQEAEVKLKTDADALRAERARIKADAVQKNEDARIAQEKFEQAKVASDEQKRIAEKQRLTAEETQRAAEQALLEAEQATAEAKKSAEQASALPNSRSSSPAGTPRFSQGSGLSALGQESTENPEGSLSSPELTSVIPLSRRSSLRVDMPGPREGQDRKAGNAGYSSGSQTPGSTTNFSSGLPPKPPYSSHARRNSFTAGEISLGLDGRTFDKSLLLKKSQSTSDLNVDLSNTSQAPRRQSGESLANPPEHDLRDTLKRASQSSSRPSTPTSSSSPFSSSANPFDALTNLFGHVLTPKASAIGASELTTSTSTATTTDLPIEVRIASAVPPPQLGNRRKSLSEQAASVLTRDSTPEPQQALQQEPGTPKGHIKLVVYNTGGTSTIATTTTATAKTDVFGISPTNGVVNRSTIRADVKKETRQVSASTGSVQDKANVFGSTIFSSGAKKDQDQAK